MSTTATTVFGVNNKKIMIIFDNDKKKTFANKGSTKIGV